MKKFYIILYVERRNLNSLFDCEDFPNIESTYRSIIFTSHSPSQFFLDPIGNQPVNTADLRAEGSHRITFVKANPVSIGQQLEYFSGK